MAINYTLSNTAFLMDASRLATVNPDLDQAINSASSDRRAQAGWAAAQWAISKTGLSHPVVSAATIGGPAEAIAALVEELDDRYFELQELCDEGGCSNSDVLAAFAQARAASALELAVQGEAAEAVYEAIACSDDASELYRAVTVALK